MGYYFAIVQHIVLFLYFLLLSSGFAGVTVTVLLWRRLRLALLGWFVGVMSIFTIWLVVTLVVYYFDSIVLYPGSFTPLLNLAGYFLGLAIYVLMMFCILLANPEGGRLVPLLFASPLAATYLYVLLAVTVARNLLPVTRSAQTLYSFVSMAAGSIYVGYTGYAFRRAGSTLKQETASYFLRRLGMLMMLFAPAAIASSATMIVLHAEYDPTVILDFILFFGWNVLAILTFVRYLVRPTALLDEGKVSPAFSTEYGISPREIEVVELISHGMSNKEIAGHLNISFTTARTHVYNIFQKTGARSRVELLRIVSGYRE